MSRCPQCNKELTHSWALEAIGAITLAHSWALEAIGAITLAVAIVGALGWLILHLKWVPL